jgi:integrase
MVYSWEVFLKISGGTSNYKSVNNLVRHLKFRGIGSESSRRTYCNAVYALCKYAGKLPDELVKLQKAEIEEMINDFCYKKMENNWSRRTANTFIFMLKTFFKVNGFKCSQSLDLDGFHQSARERTKPEYIPTLEEALRMADVAGSLRDRAIILVILSTGLRNGTIRALLYGEVKDELDKGQPNILIKVHKGMKKIVFSACKGDIGYCVFTSVEATEALKLYLSYRRRFGEIQEAEILFCSEHNRLSRKERASKPLTARDLQIIVKSAARKAGIREWENVVPHSVRKTFESVLRSQFADGGRLDLKTQEYFMGHILRGSMDTYYDKTKIEALRKEYAKLIFKPEKQVSVEVLDSLQGMAKIFGIDLARLEESKAEELGREPNDTEKFIIAQRAIKKLVTDFNNAVESNAKALLTRSCAEFRSEQCSTEKTETSSENGILLDNEMSQQHSLSTGSQVVHLSTGQTNDSQRSIAYSPIQLNLEMRPQKCSIRQKKIRLRKRRFPTESSTNLSQFFNV